MAQTFQRRQRSNGYQSLRSKQYSSAFSASGGNIHCEFVSERTTVNHIVCVEVLKRLIDAVRRKRGELWRDRSLTLHREIAGIFFASIVAVCHGTSAVLS
jgi:hypothetical protein